MTQKQTQIIQLTILVALIFCTALFFFFMSGSKIANGSVNDASAAYNSTSTVSAFNGQAVSNPQVLSLGYGTFGSVIITGASGANTGTINFYDATSTAGHSDYATTTLASFPAATAAGTYVFDVKYIRGLVMEVIGTVGTSTVTWKK